ncbi:MAG: 16S rRNA (guanine(527)-N(7))-methyltransferase RsmG [Clostridia bacterium]|nr:16S rRNA (guanine(527)-N(7))-methyltransferase RsmG [Clostridia bacterium]
MEYIEFEKIFKEECEKNKICSIINIDKFYNYMKFLLDWNEKINLTAIKEENEFIVKHFVDSLIINNLVKDKDKIIDVGTGAGFPGIPLKLFNVEQKITLIDSVGKKIKVLNDVIEKLDLKYIEAIHIRAEDLARDNKYRECFDIAVSRAVANMSTLVEYLIPFVKVGGLIICMKGPKIDEELESSRSAINLLGGRVDYIENFNISGEFERNVIVIKKVKNTPNKYPRGQGKALKEPL